MSCAADFTSRSAGGGGGAEPSTGGGGTARSTGGGGGIGSDGGGGGVEGLSMGSAGGVRNVPPTWPFVTMPFMTAFEGATEHSI